MNQKNEIFVFCENIKNIRAARSLSTKEMASALGISTKSLNLIESRILPKRLTTDVFFHIQKALGISPCEMFSENLSIAKKQ